MLTGPPQTKGIGSNGRGRGWEPRPLGSLQLLFWGGGLGLGAQTPGFFSVLGIGLGGGGEADIWGL